MTGGFLFFLTCGGHRERKAGSAAGELGHPSFGKWSYASFAWEYCIEYPLVMTNIAIENGYL